MKLVKCEKTECFLNKIRNGVAHECTARWNLVCELIGLSTQTEKIRAGSCLKQSPQVASRVVGNGSTKHLVYCFGLLLIYHSFLISLRYSNLEKR